MLLPITELTHKSWQLYVSHLKQFLLYIILFFLTGPLYFVFTMTVVSVNALLLSRDLSWAIILPIDALLGLALFVATLLIYFLIFISFSQLVKSLLNGTQAPAFLPSLRSNRQIALSASLVSVLVSLIILGGSLLFLIPGLIFTVWYSFAVNEVIFDEKTGAAALRASKNLVVGRWWTIFGRIIIPSFFFILCAFALQFSIGWLLELFLSAPLANTIETVISGTLNAFLTPLIYVCALVLYFNAKENPVPEPMAPPLPPVV